VRRPQSPAMPGSSRSSVCSATTCTPTRTPMRSTRRASPFRTAPAPAP